MMLMVMAVAGLQLLSFVMAVARLQIVSSLVVAVEEL